MNVVNFHLTNACNYNCTYCFGKFPDKQELSLTDAYAVVDNIARYFKLQGIKDRRINLAGGEPLMYPHLEELIDYINAYGIRVSVITNGSLLTEDIITGWKNRVFCIGISVDTAVIKTNATIGRCCKNKTISTKQLIRLTQAIHRNGIKLKINTVVSKLNVNEDMTELYKRLKPDRLKLLQMELVGGINDLAKGLAISKKAFDKFCERHKNCCFDSVPEYSDDMENSYLMINPQGEIQLNNQGKYETYGNCIEQDLLTILEKLPICTEKFFARYDFKTNNELVVNTSKKICVFGGHETWLKTMQELLPNVKFFKSGDLHSVESIPNADEIWIQPNAISHSFYGNVMKTAQRNKVPVHYFKFASHIKCAEQIKESS